MYLQEIWDRTWSQDWVEFRSYMVGSESFLFSYRLDGRATIDRVASSGELEKRYDQKWTPGWSEFAIVRPAGSNLPYLLSYKAFEGRASLDQISADGTAMQNVPTKSPWSPGWADFLGFQTQGLAFVFSYDSAAEAQDDVIARIDQVGTGGIGVNVYERVWDSSWTDFVIAYLAGEPHMLSYKSISGEAQLDRLVRDASSGTVWFQKAWDATWRGDWSNYLSFVSGGTTYVFSYRSTWEGTWGAIDSIDSNGVARAYEGQWSSGWSAFAILDVGGQPALLSYKRDEARANLSKIVI